MAVELLRTSLFAETWTGSAASEAPEGRPWGGAEGTPLSAASRLRMDDARGAWSVFEVEATPTANADAAAAGVQQAAVRGQLRYLSVSPFFPCRSFALTGGLQQAR